jgi:hypothetical protein
MTIELKPSPQQQIEQTPGAIAQRLQGSIGLIPYFWQSLPYPLLPSSSD